MYYTNDSLNFVPNPLGLLYKFCFVGRIKRRVLRSLHVKYTENCTAVAQNDTSVLNVHRDSSTELEF